MDDNANVFVLFIRVEAWHYGIEIPEFSAIFIAQK